MDGRQATGLVGLVLISLVVFTEPGRDLYSTAVTWASDVAAEWFESELEEQERRRQEREAAVEPEGCGDTVAPVGAAVSEDEAIRAAVTFWGLKKRVRCAKAETEFFTAEGEPRWSITLPRTNDCQLTAVIDASTGKALEGGGGCP